jgi:hypothetical protein
MSQKNPYPLDYGYEDNHNIPISGYGLTVNSINHFAFKHGLATDVFDAEDPDDIFDTVEQKRTEFSYLRPANETEQFILVYSRAYDDGNNALLSREKLNQQLYELLVDLLTVPEEIRADLLAFVNTYADDISTTDYS